MKLSVFALLAVTVFGVNSIAVRDIQSRLVGHTSHGKVQGHERITVGLEQTFYSFEGIPFAKPPIGDLRFAPPQPIEDWTHIHDATNSPHPCIQGTDADMVGREDCLYLNIYTPILPSEGTDKPLPVMAWIYGGGFEGGTSAYNQYAPDYLVEKGVIVVTLNYRLGVFGFLSTGDEVVPGNNGLKDQILALKWIQNNIGYFGGDPNKVTIFGQSAGSASASYLIQSPAAKGLFQQAILHSGVTLSLWAKSRLAKDLAFGIGEKLGLTTTNSQELINHLKGVDAIELQTIGKTLASDILLANNPRDGFVLAPVIEPEHSDAILTDKSHKLLEAGQFNAVPTIIGYTSLEGFFEFGLVMRLVLSKFDSNPDMLVPIDMNIQDTTQKKDIGKIIKKHYFGNKLISFSGIEVNVYISEDQFVRPVQEFAKQISRNNSVYLYRFSYEGNLAGLGERALAGVAHSEDLAYIFRSPFEPNQQDIIARERMTKMWTDFAKTGNPTPSQDALLQNTVWPVVSSKGAENLVYLEINDNLTVGENPQAANMKFWKDLYATYSQGIHDTY